MKSLASIIFDAMRDDFSVEFTQSLVRPNNIEVRVTTKVSGNFYGAIAETSGLFLEPAIETAISICREEISKGKKKKTWQKRKLKSR